MIRRFVVLIAFGIALCAAADNRQVVEEIVAKVNGDIITRASSSKKRAEMEAEASAQGLTGAKPAAGR